MSFKIYGVSVMHKNIDNYEVWDLSEDDFFAERTEAEQVVATLRANISEHDKWERDYNVEEITVKGDPPQCHLAHVLSALNGGPFCTPGKEQGA